MGVDSGMRVDFMGYTCFCHHLLGHLLGVFFGVDIDSSGWRL